MARKRRGLSFRNRPPGAPAASPQSRERCRPLREASAMTDASVIVNDRRTERDWSTSRTTPEVGRALKYLSDRLRDATIAAPLSALSLAFMLGVMVTRRR